MAWTAQGNIRGPQGVQGVKGDTGATGAKGDTGAAGAVGVTPRGLWSSLNSYNVSDLVTWGGSSYWCTTARSAGQAPPTGTSGNPGVDDTATNTGWSLFVMEGAKGATGDTGPAGAGSQGPRGTAWFTGNGAPGTISGSAAGDLYLDLATGNVYTLV